MLGVIARQTRRLLQTDTGDAAKSLKTTTVDPVKKAKSRGNANKTDRDHVKEAGSKSSKSTSGGTRSTASSTTSSSTSTSASTIYIPTVRLDAIMEGQGNTSTRASPSAHTSTITNLVDYTHITAFHEPLLQQRRATGTQSQLTATHRHVLDAMAHALARNPTYSMAEKKRAFELAVDFIEGRATTSDGDKEQRFRVRALEGTQQQRSYERLVGKKPTEITLK